MSARVLSLFDLDNFTDTVKEDSKTVETTKGKKELPLEIQQPEENISNNFDNLTSLFETIEQPESIEENEIKNEVNITTNINLSDIEVENENLENIDNNVVSEKTTELVENSSLHEETNINIENDERPDEIESTDIENLNEKEESLEIITTETSEIINNESIIETTALADQKTEEPTSEIEKVEKSSKKETQSTKKNNEKNETIPAVWKGDKQYYSIGEVAEFFKVKTSHIRFWTIEFDIKVRTNGKGDRLYTNQQIQELRAIYNLVKERGFTIAGAKAKLRGKNKLEVETLDLKQMLTQLKNKLIIIKKQLN